jgi:hypothetical protein
MLGVTTNGAGSLDSSIQFPQASSSSSGGPGSGACSALSQKKTCPYCFQQLSWHALSRHIRDMHRAKSNFVTCKFCNKMFRNKNSLGCHMWRFHKEAKEKEAASIGGQGGTASKMMADEQDNVGGHEVD